MGYNFNTRPYIVLNGKDSRSIKGLIISKLPPISKPLLRTLIEEVDGTVVECNTAYAGERNTTKKQEYLGMEYVG